MRITEIASPEDQLALWKMVSDSMWAAFSQHVPQGAVGQGVPTPPVSTAAPSRAKPTDRPIIKAARKLKEKPKPRAAMVPAPPPPKPPAPKAPAPPRPGTQAETKKSQMAANSAPDQPSQKQAPLTSTQKSRQEALQHQQLVKYLQRALAQPQKPQRIQLQPPSLAEPINAG